MSAPAIREVQVTFDAADPNALAGFWCEVLGCECDPPPAGFIVMQDPEGNEFCLD